jgi:lipoyl synthase
VLQLARRLAAAEGTPLLIKSGLMLGLGETNAEVREALQLLREQGVQLITLGQYLKPLNLEDKLNVQRYVPPEEFRELADFARSIGFSGVAANPLTRSSHLAETLYAQAMDGLQ